MIIRTEVEAPYGKRHGITHATRYAAGHDLSCLEPITVEPHTMCEVHTGVWIKDVVYANEYEPRNLVYLLCPRSGISKAGLLLVNTPGVIDADYRGELIALMYNITDEPIFFAANTRICQMIFLNHTQVQIEGEYKRWEDIYSEPRGAKGFGSTGKGENE